MASKHTDPDGDESTGDGPTPPPEGIYDDNALRAEIDRLIDNESDNRPANETERSARVEALRAKIQGGSYMSEEMIGEIVDKLLRKWKL